MTQPTPSALQSFVLGWWWNVAARQQRGRLSATNNMTTTTRTACNHTHDGEAVLTASALCWNGYRYWYDILSTIIPGIMQCTATWCGTKYSISISEVITSTFRRSGPSSDCSLVLGYKSPRFLVWKYKTLYLPKLIISFMVGSRKLAV